MEFRGASFPTYGPPVDCNFHFLIGPSLVPIDREGGHHSRNAVPLLCAVQLSKIRNRPPLAPTALLSSPDILHSLSSDVSRIPSSGPAMVPPNPGAAPLATADVSPLGLLHSYSATWRPRAIGVAEHLKTRWTTSTRYIPTTSDSTSQRVPIDRGMAPSLPGEIFEPQIYPHDHGHGQFRVP